MRRPFIVQWLLPLFIGFSYKTYRSRPREFTGLPLMYACWSSKEDMRLDVCVLVIQEEETGCTRVAHLGTEGSWKSWGNWEFLSHSTLFIRFENNFSRALSQARNSWQARMKTQNGKVMAGDLPPLMVRLKAFRETYSEADIRGILSGLDSDFGDEIHPSLRLNVSCSFMIF
ncbi:hypothetical protein ACFX2J_032271 [Malus domestica]